MPYGLYLSAEGAHAQATRLEVIANNLANVDTVGFKRMLATFEARYAEAIDQGLESPGTGSIDDIGGGVLVQSTQTDFATGPLKQTKAVTDLAITGEGFFVVRKGDEQLLTRAGNFRLTERGELVTQQGYPVLSENGSPIVVNPAAGPIEVSPDGVIRQQGGGQALAVVAPASLGDLVRIGENLFKPLSDPQPVAPAKRSVASGYLEMSGVRPTSEMVEMIQASRAIEANLNMVQTQDQMFSSLVNRLMRS